MPHSTTMGDYPERPTNENPTPQPNGIPMYRRYYQDPATTPPTVPLPTRPTTTGGRISRIIEIIDVTDLPNGVHHEQPPLIAPAQPSRDNSSSSAGTNVSTLTSAPTYDEDDDDDDSGGSLSGSVRHPVTSSPALVVVEEGVHRIAAAEATSGSDQPNDYGTAVRAPPIARNSRFSRDDRGEEEEEEEEGEGGGGEGEDLRAMRRRGEGGELEDV